MQSQRPPTTDDMEIALHSLHCADTMDGAVAAHNVTADCGHGYFAGMSEGDGLWWESAIAPMT